MLLMATIIDTTVMSISIWDAVTPWNPGDDVLTIDVTNLVDTNGNPIQVGCTTTNYVIFTPPPDLGD